MTNIVSKSADVKDVKYSGTDSVPVKTEPFSMNVDLSMMNDPARFENRPTTDILDTKPLLPAVFDKFTLPSSKIEKIDVTKYLSQRDQDNHKTDDDDDDYEAMSSGIDDALTDYIVGKDRTRDPRNSLSSMVEKVTRELQNKQQPFEFFNRQIPETSHPTPESLDTKAEPSSTSKHRSSIYESSRSPLHDDHTGMTTTTTKDKDMRLSSLFMDDTSNGKCVCVWQYAVKVKFVKLSSLQGTLISDCHSNQPTSYQLRKSMHVKRRTLTSNTK